MVVWPGDVNQARLWAILPLNIDTQSSDETSNRPFHKGFAATWLKGALTRFARGRRVRNGPVMARFLPAKRRFRANWNEPQRMKCNRVNQLEFASHGLAARHGWSAQRRSVRVGET